MEHSRRTKRSYTNDKIRAARFLAWFSGRMASDITTKELEDFRADMIVERKIATVNLYLKFLKAAYNRAIRQGRLTFNPLAPMRLQRENNARNRCLGPEEEARLMETLPPRLRPMVAVALHTGIRRGELRRLMWADVDFDTATIRVGLDKAGDGRGRDEQRRARGAFGGQACATGTRSLRLLVAGGEVSPQLRAVLASGRPSRQRTSPISASMIYATPSQAA
jgi:integrase